MGLILHDAGRFHTSFIMGEKIPVYSAASIILPSYVESVGVSAAAHDYAGYGLPIVTSDEGYHMKEGFDRQLVLVRPNDEADLASKLIQLLASEDMRGIGDSILRYAKDNPWTQAADKTMQNYRYILEY